MKTSVVDSDLTIQLISDPAPDPDRPNKNMRSYKQHNRTSKISKLFRKNVNYQRRIRLSEVKRNYITNSNVGTDCHVQKVGIQNVSGGRGVKNGRRKVGCMHIFETNLARK